MLGYSVGFNIAYLQYLLPTYTAYTSKCCRNMGHSLLRSTIAEQILSNYKKRYPTLIVLGHNPSEEQSLVNKFRIVKLT